MTTMTTTAIEPNRAATGAFKPAVSAATGADVTLRDDERQRCEIWTRVMGYHRPVASFNIGKQGEFAERLYFEQPASVTADVGGSGAAGGR